jgi:hypothetical protein
MINEADKFLEYLSQGADPRFDPFFNFLIEKGIGKKLSCKDIRDIFFYFKENWNRDEKQ